MSPSGTLLVIGSGPGIGRTTAFLFAERGFNHVILLSRDSKRLAVDAETVEKAAGSGNGKVRVDTLELDLAGNKESVNGVLEKVDGLLKEGGRELEVVLYNGARVGPSVLMEWGVEGLEEDLRVSFLRFCFLRFFQVVELVLLF